MNKILVYVYGVRLAILFLVSYGFNFVIPYLGNFAYKEALRGFGFPTWFTAFINFDGIHYIKIAQQGYEQYTQAFFPLYPLLIRHLALLFNPVNAISFIFSALFISNVSFLVALYFLQRLIPLIDKKISSSWVILFLLAFPTSFFFNAAYTESLFLMLVMASLYFLKTKRFLLSALLAALSSATRLVGVFLVIPFLFAYYKSSDEVSARRAVWFSVFALVGLAGYMLYLYRTTGDPLYFFTVQSQFALNRSTHLILFPQVYFRYAKILILTKPTFSYIISCLEASMFTFALLASAWEARRAWKEENFFYLGVALFSLIIILLPSTTGTFLSIPRFVLTALAPFIFLARLKNARLKVEIIVGFFLLQLVLFGFFVQGYFVS